MNEVELLEAAVRSLTDERNRLKVNLKIAVDALQESYDGIERSAPDTIWCKNGMTTVYECIEFALHKIRGKNGG